MVWGNGGDYDGYYETNDLHYYDTNFSNNQRAIINIYPSTNEDMCRTELPLDRYYSTFYSNSANSSYHPYNITPQTMTTLTSASASSPSSWRTIPAGASAVYQAHEEVVLQDGFEAEYGSEFEARIEPCEQCDDNRAATEPDMVDSPYGSDTYGQDTNAYYSTGKPEWTEPSGLVPNPTEGPLTVAVDGEVESLVIHDVAGRPVGGWHMGTIDDTAVTLDVSPLRAGLYLLSVKTASGIKTHRFVKR